LSKDVLRLDAPAEVKRIVATIREQVFRTLRRKGAVIGLSGGVDSSVAAALCVRALGKDRVLGLLMPEVDSSPDSLALGQLMAAHLGIRSAVEDITSTLEAVGAYRRRDEAIQSVIPEYTSEHKSKLVLSSVLSGRSYNVLSIVVESPDGVQRQARLTADACLAIVSATNFKQRARMMVEYYHADRVRYAVVGTPNRVEYDQGFFVKNGDGSADLKPIAHLYKTQVFQLAEFLGIPDDVRRRPPTTDTYSLPQSQEEFYFSLPLWEFDHCLYGVTHGIPPETVSARVGLTPGRVSEVYREIARRRTATRHLHAPVLFVESRDDAECSA
jgi:NAD+ synthase